MTDIVMHDKSQNVLSAAMQESKQMLTEMSEYMQEIVVVPPSRKGKAREKGRAPRDSHHMATHVVAKLLSDDKATVGTETIGYAAFVHEGTSRQAAQPFLKEAWELTKKKYER